MTERMRWSGALVVLAALLGCRPTAKQTWTEIIRPCIDSQTLGNKVVYFGPSNKAGAGTLWRNRGDGTYALVWTTDDIKPKFGEGVVITGGNVDCKGEKKANINGSLAASMLTSAIKGISAEGSAALNKASTVSVETGGIVQEQLQEGPFRIWAQKNANSPYMQDATKKQFVVAAVVVKVKGMKATLSYKNGGAVEAKAQFKPGAPVASSIADVGANFNVKWDDDTTLELSSTDDFYIVGRLGQYSPNGVGAGAPLFRTVDPPPPWKPEEKGGLGYEPMH
jgi:hypothetical protein